MSARSDRCSPQSSPPSSSVAVRLSDPGEIAAGIPQLLGFRPTESVVLICLGGARGNRIGLTVRADLPPPALAGEFSDRLAWSAATGRPDGVVVAVVSEAPDEPGPGRHGPDLPHRALLAELTVALSRTGIGVRNALLVRSGRWWSYECPEACCRPGVGTALPGRGTVLEAASVASGVVVADSREALERRIAADPRRLATAEVCRRLAGRAATRAPGRHPADVSAEGWTAVRVALQLCAPGAATTGTRLPDDLVARVLAALQDLPVRDRSLGLALGDDAAAAEALWTECTRRAPEPLDAAPATLLAVSAWLRGDGAMADVALTRALGSDPRYRLAALLRPALAACLPPADLRALIEASSNPWPSD